MLYPVAQAGNSVTEGSLRKGLFTEVQAPSRESTGAGEAHGVPPEGARGGEGVATSQGVKM